MKQSKFSTQSFRLLVSSIALLLVFSITGCIGSAEAVGGTSQPGAGAASSVDVWYELDANLGILTIRLPDKEEGFEWAYVLPDDSPLELLTQETTDGQYVGSFRAIGDGETQIMFNYCRNDELNEVRVLELRCRDGKVAEVTDESILDMTGNTSGADRTGVDFNVDQLSGLMVGGVLGALLGGLATIGVILRLVYNIATVVGCWKVYNKLGEPGWKCLIPFYGTWVEYKYTWKPQMAIWVWVLGFGGELLMYLFEQYSLMWNVFGIISVVGWVISIIGDYKLSKSFGKGAGFTVGMVLATGIFQIILGFGKSQYIGNTTTGTQYETVAEEKETK